MAKILKAEDRPTAVLVANVASSIGALHTARRMGVRVPQDISVIGVHDLTVAPYLDPPLTTIRMALDGLGTRGVELLLERSADSEIREMVHEPMELVVRESTAPAS